MNSSDHFKCIECEFKEECFKKFIKLILASGLSQDIHFTAEESVTKLLHELGIPASLSGYKYLKSTLILMITEHDLDRNLSRTIYPRVAAMENSTTIRVEKNIRSAIEKAWTVTKSQVKEQIFANTINFEKGKPTNAEFIYAIAEYLEQVDVPLQITYPFNSIKL